MSTGIPARGLAHFVFPAMLFLVFSLPAPAQDKNPYAGDAKVAKLGESQFRANCAFCHGLGGRGGGRGPDLTRLQKHHGTADSDLFHTINEGIPGTAMPPNGTTPQGVGMTPEEIWQVITYIRSVEKKSIESAGDALHGRNLFYGTPACSTCHMVNGKGGRLGPDLSATGSARALDYLIQSVREPSRRLAGGISEAMKEFPQEYETATVEAADGNKYQGVVLNEDNFTLQMLDTREQVHLFEKDQLRTFTKSRESLMPAYDQKMLPDKDLQDIIAFLTTAEAMPGGAQMKISFALLAAAMSLCSTAVQAQVTPQRLLDSSREPQNWLMYSGDYAGRRYSTLDQINPENAKFLVPKWAYQTMAGGKFETTPLVVDGILYGTGPDDRAFALDARSGRPIWQYQRALPADIRPCCGRVNRGLAILGDKVFMGTLDAHVIALDSKTGNVIWDTTSVDYRGGYSYTLAPLVINNLVLVGISGGEYGIRGFIDAYAVATGERKWRFYTVPAPGEPGHETWEGDSWKIGGAPAWITGTFDPITNTTFWTTGNPSPSNRGEGRGGDNLYSNSLLALDPETGKLKWYFQFTKHDEHDYDATQVPVMIDRDGKHLIAQANRNGFFYIIDRITGKLVYSNAYVKQTWSTSKFPDGSPASSNAGSPTLDGTRVCPGAAGATNWMSPTYDPQTNLFYVTAREQCDIFSTAPQAYEKGHAYYGSAYFPNDETEPFWGALRAIDPADGKLKWEWKHPSPTWSGVLSTAGGLVFTGDAEGNFIALDARSGKALWHFQCGASVYASPMSYAVDGKQYVEIAAGSTIFTFTLP